MAAMISASDLERAIGSRQLQNLADLENQGAGHPDVAARIQAAIDAADSEVRSYLRGRLDIDALAPASVPPVLLEKAIQLAILNLQLKGRRETLTDADMMAAKQARAWLHDYANGMAGLSIAGATQEAALVHSPVTLAVELGVTARNREILERY